MQKYGQPDFGKPVDNGPWIAHRTLFQHQITQATKRAYPGFSWSTFFFSGFPALLRGHLSGALLGFAIYAILSIAYYFWMRDFVAALPAGQPENVIFWLMGFVSLLLLWGWYASNYNRTHRNWLRKQGYVEQKIQVEDLE